jgi:hypothetical protein
MIEEGGWTSKKYFMESHDPSICGPGDFDDAKDLLERYRRVDAQVAGEDTPEPEYDSGRTNEYNTHLDSDAISSNDDNIQSIRNYGGHNHAMIEQDRSSAYREFGRAQTPYYESYVGGYGNDRAQSQGSYNDSSSSDCDSTDAINYYSDSDADDDGIDGDDSVDDGSRNEYE